MAFSLEEKDWKELCKNVRDFSPDRLSVFCAGMEDVGIGSWDCFSISGCQNRDLFIY